MQKSAQIRCPNCGLPMRDGRCEHCLQQVRRHEEEYRQLIRTFNLRRGPPLSASNLASLYEAERRVKALLKHRQFEGVMEYPQADVLESESWWYIPYRWIGCFGFIVSKKSLKRGQTITWF